MADALRIARSVSMPSKPDSIPSNIKLPKSRAPAGLREHILRTPLPYYSGPYSVGMMDIKVPVREPRVFSSIKREHRHLLELETVLFSIYYPSAFGSGDGRAPDGQGNWSRPTWLPRPRVSVARGYGKFASIPSFLTVPWFGIPPPSWNLLSLQRCISLIKHRYDDVRLRS
jgi:platelet-activating factor acetylhydrolase